MEIIPDYPLQDLHTFRMPVKARYFTRIKSREDLLAVLALNIEPLIIIGGGSNLLPVQDFPGLVARMEIAGKEILREEEDLAWVRFGAGEEWQSCVDWALDQGLGGMENLSLIPGTAGAAPIQNIGAYGVELQDILDSVEVLLIPDGGIRQMSREECHFGYRESIFKREWKGKAVVLSIVLRLSRKPQLQLQYGDIRKVLESQGIADPGIRDVSEAVKQIRRSKLPDPARLPNAGSFFKNPLIMQEHYDRLRERDPMIPGYPAEEGWVKVPAGWMIEACGWKGKRLGQAGCHERQALVIVNHGQAQPGEILELVERIEASVLERFDIKLEREVNVL